MTVNPVWGPIVTGAQVEQAVIETLQWWMPSVLREMERKTGRPTNSLPSPRAYTVINEFAEVRGMERPTCIVVSTGRGEPERRGDGTYDAGYAVGVAIIVKADSRANANELAKIYAAAAGKVLVKWGTLGGFAAGVDLGPEDYTPIPAKLLDTASAGTVAFTVRVAGFVDDVNGPLEPDPDPTPFPHVSSVEIDVERQELP